MSLLSWSVRRRWASFVITSTLGAALLGGAAPAAAGSGSVNVPCADVAPLSSVQAGQVGRGWTVVRGQTPRPFRVEILGVYPDGVAPGRDIIMVEVSDLPGRSVIKAGGGIWSGMSGSPVYVDGKLVGAVAWGFSLAPSRIGGLTPAEDMAKLISLPSPSAAAAATADTRTSRTRLSPSLRRDLSARTGTRVAASGDFERLALPVSVSGLTSRGRQFLAEQLERQGVAARVVRGSAVSAPSGSPVTPVPGGNFAGMISYGDVTVGGVGTTTWVCDGKALAFGHPLALGGAVRYGASDATSLAIIKDGTAGSYKLAAVGDPFGTLDQDRIAGVRADLDTLPALYPVTSRVRDLDLGVRRRGRTQVTAPDWMTSIAPSHVYANLISVTDREGAGTAGLRHTIQGTRGNGSPWSLVVEDRLASSLIQFDVAYDLAGILSQIAVNAGPGTIITSIESQVNVREELRLARITQVRFSRNGAAFTDPETLRVRSGDTITVRTTLRGSDGGSTNVDLDLEVPDDVIGFGAISVLGGSSYFDDCEWDPESCAGGFNATLARLAAAPRGDDLLVQLIAETPDEEFGVVDEARRRMPDVVSGSDFTNVRIRP